MLTLWLSVLLLFSVSGSLAATIELRAGPNNSSQVRVAGRLNLGDEKEFAAKVLGISRTTLYKKIKDYRLD